MATQIRPKAPASIRQVALLSIAIAFAFTSRARSFSIPTPCNTRPMRSQTATELAQLIKGDAEGEKITLDENAGGVGLVKRTAVKISGISGRGTGSEARELVRLKTMAELDVAEAESVMDKARCRLLGVGAGREVYETKEVDATGVLDRVVVLAPIDAAKNVLASMTSAVEEDADSVTMNFLGGDELIIGEVLEACDLLVDNLDLPSKAKVTFNSVSCNDVPSDICTVTVIVSTGSADGMEDADESVARGEVYVHDGKWYTVAEGDIETALE